MNSRTLLNSHRIADKKGILARRFHVLRFVIVAQLTNKIWLDVARGVVTLEIGKFPSATVIDFKRLVIAVVTRNVLLHVPGIAQAEHLGQA